MTCAEGGTVVTDNVQLAQRIRSLKFHGPGVDAYDRQTHGRAPQAEVIAPGYKYNGGHQRRAGAGAARQNERGQQAP